MSEHHTGIDVIGARGAAALMLTHSICFIWLKEGRPGERNELAGGRGSTQCLRAEGVLPCRRGPL